MNSNLFPRFFGFYMAICILNVVELTPQLSVGDYNFANLQGKRVARQANQCNGFKCASSEVCIEEEKKCDGKVDCPDGSDEFNDCKDLDCPGFLFTCDYGACIDMVKKCDGKKDCRDNSDEANCILADFGDKISSNCKSDQFECISGQFIPLDDKCSGTPECDDKSDETKEISLNTYCPGFAFKCNYGACVRNDAKCNGVKDCLDNSDEEDCAPLTPRPPSGPTPGPTSTPVPPGTIERNAGPAEHLRPRRQSSAPASDTQQPLPTSAGGPCELPELPDNGHWFILADAVGNPNQKVSVYTVIQYECDQDYKLSSGNKYVVCNADGWSVPKMPSCLKKCPPLYSTPIINLKCEDSRGIQIKCDEATDGAVASFTCEPYYESADGIKSRRYCLQGSWDLPPPICRPVCGEKKVSAETPLVIGVNATKVEKGNYPWVTAIYQKIGSQFTNVCGGSMLTQKVILTAAHCVTDDRGKVLSKDILMIAVGKYYNKFKDVRDSQAQYSQIESIQVPFTYKADNQRFASDIALLITKDILLLSNVVQPVCYQDLPSFNLDPGLVGVISGWGYTVVGDSPSDELLEIHVPYKSDSVCYQEFPTDWADKYYTFDKMCAGHYNKSKAVCNGDSGGGLVFQNSKDKRFYIQGIVSVGHTTQGACDIQVSTLYTKVATHYVWLEKIVSQSNILIGT